MSDEYFESGQRVRYVPNHANGNINHEECEDGVVSSVSAAFVFVRFGGGTQAQACRRENLVRMDVVPISAKDVARSILQEAYDLIVRQNTLICEADDSVEPMSLRARGVDATPTLDKLRVMLEGTK